MFCWQKEKDYVSSNDVFKRVVAIITMFFSWISEMTLTHVVFLVYITNKKLILRFVLVCLSLTLIWNLYGSSFFRIIFLDRKCKKKEAYGPHIGPKHWILKLSSWGRWLLRRVCSSSYLPSSCFISIFSETNTHRFASACGHSTDWILLLTVSKSVLLSIIAKCQVLGIFFWVLWWHRR